MESLARTIAQLSEVTILPLPIMLDCPTRTTYIKQGVASTG